MRVPFSLRHAWREGRSSWKRLGLYMGAIALGVAALVAIGSFRSNLIRSIDAQTRALLGADLRLESSPPFPAEIEATLDSLRSAGVPVARVTRLGSMALAPASGLTRLVQVRAVEGGFPFYGPVETQPDGLWPLDAAARAVLVDPALLIQLDVEVGDSLAIGGGMFRIAGTVRDMTGGVAIQSAIGPRIYMPARHLEATGLIRLGSLVEYQAYLAFDDEQAMRRFLAPHMALFQQHAIDTDTPEEQAESLTSRLDDLGRFLGLVGLMALLLGGVGVASAVHVFVREKLPGIAVLRCIGATQRAMFLAYLVQTVLLGLLGALAGAALGLAVQALLPAVVGDFLPVPVAYRIHLPSVAAGVVTGAWVSLAFALLPLLAVQGIAPLQALRHDFEPTRPDRRWQALVLAALAASIVVLAMSQAPSRRFGLGFAGGIAGTLGVLWLAALGLIHGTRRFFPRRAGYVVRQGISNLFRPRNQTVAVTVALGFGVFLVATIWLVQVNLLDRFRVDRATERPNMLLFDIQTDQRADVEALLGRYGATSGTFTPIVPARIAAVNGRSPEEILADSTGKWVEPWALRREYRNTYRDSIVGTEAIVAGSWWETGARRGADAATADAPDGSASEAALPRISLEADIAGSLGVELGDRITWDFQGRAIETRITSLRTVDWARFAPNFFVVFEPGVLERAPQTVLALARLDGETRRAELQRDLVRRHPNVSVLDLALVQRTVDDILGSATFGIRFIALFSLAGGLIVLTGALATSRYQRLRESALLKTLGGSRRQVRLVLLTEYAALGALSGLVGTAAAALASWALVTRFFELEFRLPGAPLLIAWAVTIGLTVAIGFANSRDVVRRTPLAILREAAE